jgi:hypothetical protein
LAAGFFAAAFGLAVAAALGFAGAFFASFATDGFLADLATGFLILVGLPAAFGFLAPDFLTTFSLSPAAFFGLADLGFFVTASFCGWQLERA